jgi:hypothetical protein
LVQDSRYNLLGRLVHFLENLVETVRFWSFINHTFGFTARPLVVLGIGILLLFLHVKPGRYQRLDLFSLLIGKIDVTETEIPLPANQQEVSKKMKRWMEHKNTIS